MALIALVAEVMSTVKSLNDSHTGSGLYVPDVDSIEIILVSEVVLQTAPLKKVLNL